MSRRHQPLPDERPDFMIRLGLLPPYSADDVKQAYLEKVKTAHPDVGGDVADFLKLQEAFRRATEYVDFRKSRMSWLASHTERYVNQTLVIDELAALGGRVETEQIEWLEQSFGEDFSQVMETVVAIHLCGPEIGDEAVELLVREHALLHRLRSLSVQSSRITDASLRCLRVFTSVEKLDVRGTRISTPAWRLVQWFPKLRWLGTDPAGVSLLDRLRLRFSARKVTVVTSAAP